MSPCCVEGCNIVKEDTVFFEFPTSRILRRKWLDVIKIPSKVPLGTVVCSQHFNCTDYEFVRGKPRLKSKVVPTLHLQLPKSPVLPTPEADKIPPTETNHSREPDIPPLPEPTPQNKGEDGGNREAVGISPKAERELDPKGIPTEICRVISGDIKGSSKLGPEGRPQLPDPDLKHAPDFEEMITNYQIKNSKPNTLLSMDAEVNIPLLEENRTNAIHLDDDDDAAPVFIEISVDQDNNTSTAGNQDCLMVLESVQVEVDPSTLILPEREFEEEPEREHGDFDEVEKAPVRKYAPISLLTSSDEDDVILQEPHIDTVVVSDATDEDDVPLVKLVKKPPRKKSKRKPKLKIQKLASWADEFYYYCLQCPFSTLDSVEYSEHVTEHQKVIQVCSVCNYTTASKTQYTRHLRKHKDDKKFRCHLCDYRAKHNMSLIYHLQEHDKDRDFYKCVEKGFQCKSCGFRSQIEDIVLKHVGMCNQGLKRYYCKQCLYVSKRKAELKRHLNRRHAANIVEVDSGSDKSSLEEQA